MLQRLLLEAVYQTLEQNILFVYPNRTIGALAQSVCRAFNCLFFFKKGPYPAGATHYARPTIAKNIFVIAVCNSLGL